MFFSGAMTIFAPEGVRSGFGEYVVDGAHAELAPAVRRIVMDGRGRAVRTLCQGSSGGDSGALAQECRLASGTCGSDDR